MIGKTYHNQEVIDFKWFSGGATVGMVIAEDTITKGRKLYIGIVKPGETEDQSVKNIIDWGTKMSAYYACETLDEMIDLLDPTYHSLTE